MRFLLILVFLAASIAARAQIITLTEKDGKTITCMRSGLHSNVKDCGAKADWYTYVFVGVISSTSPAADDEQELQVIPEEVFHGKPPAPLTVRTSQGGCLPEFKGGDRWLFFLREQGGKPLVLSYGSRSAPVEAAQSEIDTLRRLKGIAGKGLLRGSVQSGGLGNSAPVSQAQVVVESAEEKLSYFATSNASGQYEFPPLPPGEYNIKVSPVGAFQADDSKVTVEANACWDLTLTRSPHGRIAGYVRRGNGAPAAGIDVILIEEGLYNTSKTDARGHYTFEGRRAGKYVVGINFPGAPAWKYAACGGCEPPAASMYYPGTHAKSDAQPLELTADQKLDDVNFVIPW